MSAGFVILIVLSITALIAYLILIFILWADNELPHHLRRKDKFKIDDLGSEKYNRYVLYQKTIIGVWYEICSYHTNKEAVEKMYRISKSYRKPTSEYYDLKEITDESRLIENKEK